MASITPSSSWNPKYDIALCKSITDQCKDLISVTPQEISATIQKIWQNAIDALSQKFGRSPLFTQDQLQQRYARIGPAHRSPDLLTPYEKYAIWFAFTKALSGQKAQAATVALPETRQQEVDAVLIKRNPIVTRVAIQQHSLAINSQKVRDAFTHHIITYPEELTHFPRPEDIIECIQTTKTSQSSLLSNPLNKPKNTPKKHPRSAPTLASNSISLTPTTDIVESSKPKSRRTKEGEVGEDDSLSAVPMPSSSPASSFLHLLQTHQPPFTSPPITTDSSNSTAPNASSIAPAISAAIPPTPQLLHTAHTDIAEQPNPQGTEEDEVRGDDIPSTTIRSWDLQSDLELLDSIGGMYSNANIIDTPPEIWQKAIDQLSTRFGPSPLFTQPQIQQRFAQITQAERSCKRLTPYEKYAIWFAYTQAPSGEKARAAKEALSTTRQKEVCSALIHRSVNMTQKNITEAHKLNIIEKKIQNAYANHITAYPEEKAHLPTPENIIECINNVRKQKDSITRTLPHPASSFTAPLPVPQPPHAASLAPDITELPHPQGTEEDHALDPLRFDPFTEDGEVLGNGLLPTALESMQPPRLETEEGDELDLPPIGSLEDDF